MRINRALRTWWRLTLLAVLALGLASDAPTAQAQSEQDKPAAAEKPSAAPSKSSSVTEVVVSAPRSRVIGLPPAKAAAIAAEAGKSEAWRRYRESTPPLTRDPNDQAKDYPGLQSYVPE